MKKDSRQNQSLVPVAMHRDFEGIRKVDAEGCEYWEARELMPLMGYGNWQDFHTAIRRAQIVCDGTGQNLENHFRGAPKMIIIARNTTKETKRKIVDYHLSRFACYLVAQNGDPRKPEIAFAQTYFAVQTRKQELLQSMDDDGKRLYIRHEVKVGNKKLAETAKKSGVNNFGKFNNAGYLGLYGLDADGIRKHKGIGKDDILDRAGSTELAANLFRITQTDAKLRKDREAGAPVGEVPANHTHFRVGRTVRKTIAKIGGTMPEELPPEEHVRSLVQRRIGRLPKGERSTLKPVAGRKRKK